MIQKKQSIAFNGHKKEWDTFRLICRLQDTDASKIIRKFIHDYNDEHIDAVIAYEEEKAIYEAEERADKSEIIDEIAEDIKQLKMEWEEHDK